MYKPILYQTLRLLLVICIVFGLYIIFKYVLLFLYPFLLAVILSMIIHPIVSWLETKLFFPRPVATMMIMMIGFTLLFGAIIYIVAELIHGTTYLADHVPAYFSNFIHMAEHLIENKLMPTYHKIISFFHTLSPTQQKTINDNIQQLLAHFSSTGTKFLQKALLNIPVLLSMLPSSITIFVFIMIATFLITNDWHYLKEQVVKMIPNEVHTHSKNVSFHLQKALFGYFKSQFILISITAVIIFIGLLLLKVEHALTITLITTAADLLPYIGTGVIFIPWIIYLFITADYSMTIYLTSLYMLIIILRQVIEPKVLAFNIGINPLVAIVTLFIGIQLWGLIGLFIAPSLLIILYAFYKAGIPQLIWIFIKG